MSFTEVFMIAVGLAMDAFAVALGTGTLDHVHGTRPVFRISFHFGLFQFLMPVVGWFMGINVARFVASIDHWLAFALLGFIGGKMIRAGFRPEHRRTQNDPSRGMSLIMLSLATSMDALAVGFSLALLNIAIWYPSTIIGFVAAFFSLIGMIIGRRLGERFGKIMEVIGGLILVLIGARILITHLFYM